MNDKAEGSELLTTAEVAAWLRVTPVTVSRWARVGRLRSVRLGPKMLRFRQSDVEEFLAGSAA